MCLWGRHQQLWTNRVTLTYDVLILTLYYIRYILTSWFICHIWRDSVKKAWSYETEKLKTLNNPCDLDFWLEHVCTCMTHHLLMGCISMCSTYEVNESNRPGVTKRKQKQQNPQTTCVTLKFWPFDIKMGCETSSPDGFYLHHIWSKSDK